MNLRGQGIQWFAPTSRAIETGFACISRPLERSNRDGGGPSNYPARFRITLTTPRIDQLLQLSDRLR
jgi:hypothetical protein